MLDFLFPKICISCNEEGFVLCPCCAKDLIKTNAFYVEDILITPCFEFQNTASKIVKDLKYNQASSNAKIIADLMYSNVQSIIKEADYIIPVPANIVGRFKKNYNPPSLITRHLCKKIKAKQVERKIYKKIGKSQVGLTKIERAKNVKDVFVVKKDLSFLNGKNVIILDDTITTGATILSLSQEVKKFNPKNIIGICFAFKSLN